MNFTKLAGFSYRNCLGGWYFYYWYGQKIFQKCCKNWRCNQISKRASVEMRKTCFCVTTIIYNSSNNLFIQKQKTPFDSKLFKYADFWCLQTFGDFILKSTRRCALNFCVLRQEIWEPTWNFFTFKVIRYTNLNSLHVYPFLNLTVLCT